jgi:hypothetical protein
VLPSAAGTSRMAHWGELVFQSHFYNLLILHLHSIIKNHCNNGLSYVQAIQGLNEGLPGLRFFR